MKHDARQVPCCARKLRAGQASMVVPPIGFKINVMNYMEFVFMVFRKRDCLTSQTISHIAKCPRPTGFCSCSCCSAKGATIGSPRSAIRLLRLQQSVGSGLECRMRLRCLQYRGRSLHSGKSDVQSPAREHHKRDSAESTCAENWNSLYPDWCRLC